MVFTATFFDTNGPFFRLVRRNSGSDDAVVDIITQVTRGSN
jgi:hypothetical protein